MFELIKAEDIDKVKWDQLVHRSDNALVFCYSWYLDEMCTWDAIVYDNYLGAIALPKRRRFGFKTIYQPAFIQQCPWFGEQPEKSIEFILDLLIKNYSWIKMNSNVSFGEEVKKRLNLILPLKSDIAELRGSYRSNLIRNLGKRSKYIRIDYRGTDNIEKTIELYRDVYGSLNPQLGDAEYNALSRLLHLASERNALEHLQVYERESLIAGLIFIKGKNRLHYIMGAPNARGRKLNALSHALDNLIEKYAGQNFILDFEGSSIESVAQFYRAFGSEETWFSENEIYPSRFLQLLKKLY